MASYLLDLSNAPGERNELVDVEVPADQISDSVRVLNVARSHLVSLETTPGSLLHDLVRHVTTLQVPFNQLDSLAGIEHFVSLEVLNLSHNALTVIDANMSALLHRLEGLQVIDLSYNRLRLLDLELPAGKSMPLGVASTVNRPGSVVEEGHAMHVTSLNLSHNAFIDLPDLRAMPALQVLNLDYNHIEDISDIDSKLPLLAIHTLQIRENRLPMASYAMPLAALASTVRHLQIYGNPFTLAFDEEEVVMSAQASRMNRAADSRRGSALPPGRANYGGGGNPWWWRPYLLWLMPLLQTVDTAPFTPSERSVAAVLFRDRGTLSRGHLELLNNNRRDDLDTYLRKQSERATPPANVLDTVLSLQEEDGDDGTSALQTPMRLAAPNSRATSTAAAAAAVAPAHKNRAASLGEPFAPLSNTAWVQPGGAASRKLHSGGSSTSNGRSPSATEVLAAIQQKLRSLSGVVETLWQHDMSRRIFASITIQRWYRGYATRRDLPADVYESAQFIRQQLRFHDSSSAVGGGGEARAVTGSGSRGGAPRASAGRSSGDVVRATAPVVPTGNQAADIQEVLNTMKGLQSVMTTMWEDLDEYRAMAEREQRRAAITIQRNYRGYRGRKEWRKVKSGYDEFVDTLVPFVGVLQRVGRGYVARAKMATDAEDKYEVRRLRSEVAELREEMQEMRAMLGLPAKSRASVSDGYQQQRPRLAKFDNVADSGLEDEERGHKAASVPAVECSQSATVSIIDGDYRPEDEDMCGSGDTPLRAAAPALLSRQEYPTEEEEATPAPTVTIHRRKPRGSAPLKAGHTAGEDVGSDGEARPRSSDKRIVKRRPSRGGSAEGSPKAFSQKPPVRSAEKLSSSNDGSEAEY